MAAPTGITAICWNDWS